MNPLTPTLAVPKHIITSPDQAKCYSNGFPSTYILYPSESYSFLFDLRQIESKDKHFILKRP